MTQPPLKTFVFKPITLEQIREYCTASGDWNRIHHDEGFAKESGLPGIIAHGMLSMGLMARAFKEWGFKTDALRHFDAKFRGIVLPGDILTAELVSETKSETGFDLRSRMINQKGEEILSGNGIMRSDQKFYGPD